MVKVSELRLRDVINIADGRRLGAVKDIEVDAEEGKVKAIVLPGSRGTGFWGRSEDVVIPWEKVKSIGLDVILVELKNFTEPLKRNE